MLQNQSAVNQTSCEPSESLHLLYIRLFYYLLKLILFAIVNDYTVACLYFHNIITLKYCIIKIYTSLYTFKQCMKKCCLNQVIAKIIC